MSRTDRKISVWKRIVRAVFLLALICLLVLAAFKILEFQKTPKVSAGREYLSEIHVRTEDGTVIPACLSMDQVPSSYRHEPFHHGKLERFEYRTNTYGLYGRQEKEITKTAVVYLPYGYSKEDRYNVVYLMHGAGGSAARFFGWPEAPRTLKYIVDNMINLGEIDPTIFVSLTYYPETGMDHEADWDAEYTKYYGKELIQDVLPQVEGHYSTYADSTDPEDLQASRWHRTFAGFSMGGVTAYYRLCDSLDYFHSFLAMSGSLYWGPDAADSGDDSDFGAQYIMNAVADQGYSQDDFFLLSCVGTDDFALDVVQAQISSEKQYPYYFLFGGDESPANCAFLLGDGESHSRHATDRYLYNLLPVLSDIME